MYSLYENSNIEFSLRETALSVLLGSVGLLHAKL